jgi:protein-S-isoprenylcysteine O-methyltransferase Ste14
MRMSGGVMCGSEFGRSPGSPPVRDSFGRMRERYGSGIRVPPPAIFMVAFLVGLWLEGAVYRLRIVPADAIPRPLMIAGLALVTAGVLLALWAVLTFRRHHTAVLPFYPARVMVDSGPYRYTRNPMYVGMTLAHFGGAVALNAVWPAALLPLALVFLFLTVIRKEEAHLAAAFPEEYGGYRARVRRWI